MNLAEAVAEARRRWGPLAWAEVDDSQLYTPSVGVGSKCLGSGASFEEAFADVDIDNDEQGRNHYVAPDLDPEFVAAKDRVNAALVAARNMLVSKIEDRANIPLPIVEQITKVTQMILDEWKR